MSKSESGAGAESVMQEQLTPTPAEIRSQLERVLASPAFHGSKRCQQFLEYVCEKSLSGETGALKERTIAIEVFGRDPQSDLGEDTIVRVGAREVRKRLAQYYVTADGVASEVRIDLPSGAYAPEFRHTRSLPETEAPPLPVPLVMEKPAPSHARRNTSIVAGAVAAGLAIAAIVHYTSASPNAALFDKFWAPVLESPEPLMIAVAHPIVYHFSHRAQLLALEQHPPQPNEGQTVIHLPPHEVDGSDMVPVFNQYVGFGDMVAANQVTAMLARRSKSVRLRMASGVEFADLRQTPALLIGAVTNRWTVEFEQSWRLRFVYTKDARLVIDDTETGQEWSVPAKDDGSTPDDYILASRIPNAVTGGPLIVAAGLKQFGTEAAGRLLSDPEQLGPILRQLPKGWEHKHLQVVLHARVIGNTPAQPEVVASHVW